MTIDDLIEKYRTMSTKGSTLFPQRPDIAEKSNLQYKETADCLEELKSYRENEGMSENVYRAGYKRGYNEAVYDFSREISDKIIHEIDDCADELEWIEEISKFLKDSHFTPLIPVKEVYYADIIVTGTKDKPYYQIKYREIGKDFELIGYGSYDLKLVFRWLEDYFEIVRGNAE